ncbi:MAG TPA: peptidoglycan DD-metalloendopeptidase family protein, partial [Gammaproteobacteria bacterium]|nr:peptidoglycan DD-metalloendopeptidase family protein [Gammaproteobacteria bacterium]
IAWEFGLDYRALATANHMGPPYEINVGQLLKMTNIPKGHFQIVAPPTIKQAPTTKKPIKPEHKIQKYHTYPSIPVRTWIWPTQGRVVLSFTASLAGNKGIDIAAREGQPIRAAANGEVVYSGDGVRGYGNLIIIKHNSTFLSAYAFNKSVFVRLGQRVRAGQRIALMGRNTAGKPMLHFEIRRNGQPVNPMRYLRKSSWT